MKADSMERDIERWLSFAVEVETTLHIYSDQYISGILNLLTDLRREAADVLSASTPENQDGYFRANQLAQQLRNTAHFAHNMQG